MDGEGAPRAEHEHVYKGREFAQRVAKTGQTEAAQGGAILRAATPCGVKWDGPDLDIPVADSFTLMSGKRELVIRHNGQAYRLRVTASDKLILTK